MWQLHSGQNSTQIVYTFPTAGGTPVWQESRRRAPVSAFNLSSPREIHHSLVLIRRSAARTVGAVSGTLSRRHRTTQACSKPAGPVMRSFCRSSRAKLTRCAATNFTRSFVRRSALASSRRSCKMNLNSIQFCSIPTPHVLAYPAHLQSRRSLTPHTRFEARGLHASPHCYDSVRISASGPSSGSR